jgi:subtilase family serine protease
VGNKPSLPSGARPVGTLAQSTPLTVTVTLQPRDPAALAAYAQAVATPGSSVYHRYLSVDEFAARFGPTRTQIAAARQSLSAQGLSPGPVAANGLSFSVSAVAGRVADAFNTKFERYHLRDGRTVYANTSAPQLSGSGASVIQGVIGLNNLAVEKPQGLVAHKRAATPSSSALPRTSGAAAVSACSKAVGTGGYTASDIASAYGFNGLYNAGDTGSGVTVALYELASYASGDISTYQMCYGTSTSVTQTNVDGGVSCPKNRDPTCALEAVLDIEDVIGLAPNSNIRVYEGPNSDQGAYDTYARIVTDNIAKVVSTSWGLCESQAESALVGTPAAENTLFEEAATQGQSVFAATGDSGTQDCTDSSGNPAGGRAVDDPASQPYVTGVGGTSLKSLSSPLDETVWNDGSGGGSGGGGVSTLWPRPSYQSGFALSQSAITCGSAGFTCREVPDVSADADPNKGYAIYFSGLGGWTTIGGTSAAAPTWASLTTLADASSACTTTVGFANPGLYGAAREAYGSDFNDVRSGDNSYDDVTGYAAGTGYDMASGLGSPKGTALAAALCGSVGDSVTLTGSPKSQTSTAGRAITPVTISATSRNGANPITYSASGLPRGLSINRSSGQVSGTPSKPGRYSVTLTAVDHDGMIATDPLTWTVRAPAVRLKAVSRKTTRVKKSVRIALHATDSVGAALTYKASNLPPGLRINHHTGVISGKPTRKVTRKVTVRALDAYGGSAKRRFTVVVRSRG